MNEEKHSKLAWFAWGWVVIGLWDTGVYGVIDGINKTRDHGRYIKEKPIQFFTPLELAQMAEKDKTT